MNTLVKVGILGAVGFVAYNLIIQGQKKFAQLSDQFAYKIDSLGKPQFKSGVLTVPITLAINNPSPIAIPIDRLTIKLNVVNQGQLTPAGGANMPAFTVQPGINKITFSPSVDIAKLNPFANGSGTIFDKAISLLNSTNPLISIAADTEITIKGIILKNQITTGYYFSDFTNALKKPSLGLVPNGKRTTKPIPQNLLALVPTPAGKNEVVKRMDADPETDTVPMIIQNVKRQLWQGKALAKALKKASVYDTAKADWEFIFNHIQFVEDPINKETVRSLRRLVYDKKGDCDCFVSALSNLLQNQNIPHKLRIAAYNGSPDYSHIYIIIPTGNGNYLTVDPVVHQFNYEEPFTSKKDFNV